MEGRRNECLYVSGVVNRDSISRRQQYVTLKCELISIIILLIVLFFEYL